MCRHAATAPPHPGASTDALRAGCLPASGRGGVSVGRSGATGSPGRTRGAAAAACCGGRHPGSQVSWCRSLGVSVEGAVSLKVQQGLQGLCCAAQPGGVPQPARAHQAAATPHLLQLHPTAPHVPLCKAAFAFASRAPPPPHGPSPTSLQGAAAALPLRCSLLRLLPARATRRPGPAPRLHRRGLSGSAGAGSGAGSRRAARARAAAAAAGAAGVQQGRGGAAPGKLAWGCMERQVCRRRPWQLPLACCHCIAFLPLCSCSVFLLAPPPCPPACPCARPLPCDR